MAKSLQFSFHGNTYEAVPEKLERKKLYGWTDTIATDEAGEECLSAQLAPGGTLIVPPSGVKLATLDEDGKWLEKSELTPVDEDGKEILGVASSFDAPIVLSEKASDEEFLDHIWKAVYQVDNGELAALLDEKEIYSFPFSYRGGLSADEGFLLKSGENLFLFAGEKVEFSMLGVAEEGVLDDQEEAPAEEESDELDFSMM